MRKFLPVRGQMARVWLGIWIALAAGGKLWAATAASNDLAVTGLNRAIIISIVTNGVTPDSNRVGLLLVTAPAHGTAVINSNTAVLTPQLSNLFSFAAVQLSNSVVQVGSTNMYPRHTLTNGTNAGKWSNSTVSDWIVGFFPGAMWYVYEQTGDTNYLNWARKWTAGIASQKHVTNDDDVGFMFNTSFGNGQRITGDTNYLAILTTAAQSMTNNYFPVTRSVGESLPPTNEEVILDTMMNLGLLYHMADLNSNTNFSMEAFNHQQRAMTNQIRTNNSTYHMVYYSTVNGSLTFQGTRSGYANSSTWARGHAWAIYGFTTGYKETGYLPFLDAAQRVAQYYIDNVPPDYVPYWDFNDPSIPNAPRDSSAAAITMSGLVNLSQITTNLTNSAEYWSEANHILQSLGSSNYLAKGTTSSSILLHGTGESPQLPNPEVNVGLIYGDYYFVEALRRFALVYGQHSVTYTPEPGFTGVDTFTYETADSGGNCATATVTVVVQPTNAAPAFAATVSVPPTTTQPTITFPTTSGYLYDVQYNDNLSSNTWMTLATNLVGNGSNISVCDPSPANARLYRVQVK